MGRTIFVGRDKEKRELARRMRAHAVTVLLGRGGLGKTALALEALRPLRPRAIHVGVRPGDDARQVLLTVVRALTAETKTLTPTTLGDVDALIAQACALAERDRRVLFLDDWHHLATGEQATVLSAIHREASRSRWLIAARTLEPIPELVEHRLTLKELDERSLRLLARRLAPAMTTRKASELARDAHGSPWILRRCVWSTDDDPVAPDELLAALPATAAALVRLLGALELPIDRATFGALARPAVARSIGRGLLETGADGGVRVHDVVIDRLRGERPSLVEARALATAGRGDARALLEAIRLHLDNASNDDAAEVLRDSFDEIVGAGFAPRLHEVLEPTSAPTLASYRLRAAATLGCGPPLEMVLADPRASTIEAQVRHAEALLVAGRFVDARVTLEAALPAIPATESELRIDAILLLARTRLMLGEEPTELVGLEAMGAHGHRLTALRARVLVARGDYRAALALADELGAVVRSLPPGARREVQRLRLTVYSNAGRLAQVRALANDLYGDPTVGVSIVEAQSALASLSLLAIEGGRLADGRRLLDLLSPHATRGALRFVHKMNTLRLHTIEGDFAAAERGADEVCDDARLAGDRDALAWGDVARTFVRLLLASEHEPSTDEHATLPLRGPQAAFRRAFGWLSALRNGEGADVVPPSSGETDDVIDARVYTLLAQATARFFAGALDDAAAGTRAAITLAESNGYRAHALECRLFLADILLVAKKTHAAVTVARELQQAARELPSRRFELEAAHLLALAGAVTPTVSELEHAAASERVAPSAARRTRFILGLSTRLDAVDRRVLDARGLIEPSWVLGNAPADPCAPSWGLDLVEGRSWFPDGTTKRLAASSLSARLLTVLAESGGAVTKEQLVSAAWNVTRYHPLRDDKRLQVAILRLRRVVEERPARPRRIVMTPEGYALGNEEPMRVRRRELR